MTTHQLLAQITRYRFLQAGANRIWLFRLKMFDRGHDHTLDEFFSAELRCADREVLAALPHVPMVAGE